MPINNHLRPQRDATAKLEANFTELGLGKRDHPVDIEGECLWVPASVRHDVRPALARNSFFVYGGVNLQANIRFSNQGPGGRPLGGVPPSRYSGGSPFNPAGSAGAAKAWSMKARLKSADLPTQGKIRFVPQKNYTPSEPLRRGIAGGYIDRFGNEWTKGPSRTSGQAFEWDVQLSHTGRAKLGWASRDGQHVNISLNGRFTHR